MGDTVAIIWTIKHQNMKGWKEEKAWNPSFHLHWFSLFLVCCYFSFYPSYFLQLEMLLLYRDEDIFIHSGFYTQNFFSTSRYNRIFFLFFSFFLLIFLFFVTKGFSRVTSTLHPHPGKKTVTQTLKQY